MIGSFTEKLVAEVGLCTECLRGRVTLLHDYTNIDDDDERMDVQTDDDMY